MSLSRQVLSSPFDAPQRPRTEASIQNGDRKRVKEGGSNLASNIMVDTRVVRRSIFNPSMVKNNSAEESSTEPGCILFDSRLIRGDVFANPIVTVTGGQQSDDENQKRNDACSRRAISTPPPVKGRHHAEVQTDDYPDMNETLSCAEAHCPDDTAITAVIGVDSGQEGDQAPEPLANEGCHELEMQKENLAPII